MTQNIRYLSLTMSVTLFPTIWLCDFILLALALALAMNVCVCATFACLPFYVDKDQEILSVASSITFLFASACATVLCQHFSR